VLIGETYRKGKLFLINLSQFINTLYIFMNSERFNFIDQDSSLKTDKAWETEAASAVSGDKRKCQYNPNCISKHSHGGICVH
jgi:hypothetical protein